MKALWLLIMVAFFLSPSMMALGQQNIDHSKMLRRVKPAVVLVYYKVTAIIRVQIDKRQKEFKDEISNQGSGFIVNPSGYIVTNGHMVESYREPNKEIEGFFIRKVIREHFLPNEIKRISSKRPVSDPEKDQILNSLVNQLSPKIQVNMAKTLNVVLSNGKKYNAEIKAYSAPIFVMPGRFSLSMDGSKKEIDTGKDIAILKIEQRYLPNVKIGDANSLQLGELVHAIGFPGGVLAHDYLSEKTALDASVTGGIVSGLKVNTQQASVIQTTAPIARGNSGGPVFNSRGEVIGIATFASIDQGTGELIQGFNFLVSANTAMEFIRDSGIDLQEESLFNKLWFEALDLFSTGKFEKALSKFDEVLRVFPNQPDAQALQVVAQTKVKPGSPVLPIVIVVSLIAIAVGLTAYLPRRRKRGASQASVTFVHQETPAMSPWLGSLVGQAGPLMGKTFSIGGSGVRIGRDPGRNQIAIDDPEVSREHAWVGEENGMMVVRDLNSVNGTFINTTDADRVQNAQLRNGDVIIIGKGNNASFRYQAAHDG